VSKVDVDTADAVFNGGCLNDEDSRNVQKLSCTDDLSNEEVMKKLGIATIDSFGTLKVPS